MRLFILFIPFLLIYSSGGFSQGNVQYKNLPAAQKKIIKKEIKALSTKNKLLSFVLLQEEYVDEFKNSIGGFMLKPARADQTITPATDLLKIVNLAPIKYYHQVPFPEKNTRSRERLLPVWLPSVFGANYIADLDTTFSQTLFYGLDSLGIYFTHTTYHSWDSLLLATLQHDLIYTPQSAGVLVGEIEKLKVKSAQKKALEEKLRNKLIAELVRTSEPETSPSQESVMQWIWQTYAGSIDLNGADKILPIQSPDSLEICAFSFARHQFEPFTSALSRYAEVPAYTASLSTEKEIARLTAYDLVIIPLSELDAGREAFLHEIGNATEVLVLASGQNAAELVETLETLNVAIVTMPENNQLAQSVLAGTLFGAFRSDFSHEILKYGIPELVGMDSDTLFKINELVTEAIHQQAIPGCQVLVVKDGTVIWNRAYGYQTYDSITPVTEHTLYDLASITKVLATTQGIMYLLEQGSISLDAPLSNYLNYLQHTNKSKITIRQIMAHQAGLYPYYPFWKKAREELKLEDSSANRDVQVGKSIWVNSAVEDSVLYWAATSDLLAERIDTITHEQYMYSDIGFYLLKDLIEQQTHQPLDLFLGKQLYKPLGTSLVFNPTCFYPVSELAPTEEDKLLRREVVQGFVHDRNAALMGGVAGQAGLFGNANDVAIMLQLQLNGGDYGAHRYFDAATIKQFISRQYDNNRRGLGWDMPGTEPDGPVSALASEETFGHTGFTGGSIWADPKESLIFVFLSNRVYPSVENTKLIDLNIRTRIQDIVYRAIKK